MQSGEGLLLLPNHSFSSSASGFSRFSTVMSVGHLVGDNRKCNPFVKKLKGKTSPICLLSFFFTVTTQKPNNLKKKNCSPFVKSPHKNYGNGHEQQVFQTVAFSPLKLHFSETGGFTSSTGAQHHRRLLQEIRSSSGRTVSTGTRSFSRVGYSHS